jgi:hypothetical protein
MHLAGKVRNVTFAMCPKHAAFLVLTNGSRGRITTKGVIQVSHSISLRSRAGVIAVFNKVGVTAFFGQNQNFASLIALKVILL